MCKIYLVCMFTFVDIVKHVKDTMRDNSCITQLGQSISGAAGSSSRQMENVLVPLHAWTHSPPSAANTARSLANLRHNFKGTWFWEPANRAAGLRLSRFVWKREGTASTFQRAHQLFQLLMRQREDSPFHRLYYSYSTFRNSHGSIHVPKFPFTELIFRLYSLPSVIWRAVEHHGRTFHGVYGCSGSAVQSRQNLNVREGY